MIVYINENYEIVSTSETNIYQGSDRFDLVQLAIPKTLENQYPTITFMRADGRVFGPLAHTEIAVDDNNNIYTWELSKKIIAVEGVLQFTFTINFTQDGKVIKTKNIAKAYAQIYEAVVSEDDVIIVGDFSVESIRESIQNLEVQSANTSLDTAQIKSAYIKSVDYDSETFTISVKKEDNSILNIELPFKYLKLFYDSTTFTEITNDGQNHKIVAENDDNVSTQNQIYNQISREVKDKLSEDLLNEIISSSHYKIEIESPNHGSDDVSYITFIEMLSTALTLSSTNGVNTAVLKIDGNTGKITYNGKEIGNQEDIDTLKKDVKLNTQNRHNHTNKAVLDQIKNLGGANGVATLDGQGRLAQPVVKAEQDGVGNVINLYYQGKTLSVPVGNYMTVEECLAGLKSEIEVLIGGTITQEDLDTLKEISDAVLTAQGDIKKLQDAINEILLENVPVATRETAGIVKIGNNISVAEDGTISIDLSGYATTNDVNTAKNEAVSTASADATAKANNALASAKSYTNDELKKLQFKTINGETITGVGDIEINGYDKLYGTWLLNETLTTEDVSFMFAFESNGTTFNKISFTTIQGVSTKNLNYGGTSVVSVYNTGDGWLRPEYRKIEIYDNLPADKETFATWLKANAVKGGNVDSGSGGAGEVAEVSGDTLVFKKASSGNDIVINSTEEATEELTNIKQGNKVYSVPSSGSSGGRTQLYLHEATIGYTQRFKFSFINSDSESFNATKKQVIGDLIYGVDTQNNKMFYVVNASSLPGGTSDRGTPEGYYSDGTSVSFGWLTGDWSSDIVTPL